MAFGDANQFAAPAAQTANGNTAAIACERGLNLSVLANVSAASGTSPSMTLEIQWSMDGVNFFSVDTTKDAFAALTAAGGAVKTVPVKAPFFRVAWVITGTTPSFTFTLWKYITE